MAQIAPKYHVQKLMKKIPLHQQLRMERSLAQVTEEDVPDTCIVATQVSMPTAILAEGILFSPCPKKPGNGSEFFEFLTSLILELEK